MISSKIYFQPHSFRRPSPERLVLQDESGNWYLWIGEPGNGVVEVPANLAAWTIERLEMELMPIPRMWFELEALPLAPAAPVTPGTPPASESTVSGD